MAKKIVLIVVGAVLVFCGLGATVPGAILTAVTGSDSTLESGFHRLNTATPALVSETARVSRASGVRGGGLGAGTITITARSAGPPIFLGVARASDVDAYLSGVAYDEVMEFELRPYRVETVRRHGRASAEPPGDQMFWAASVSGPAPTLEWRVTEGDYRLVMMNADGSAATAADTQLGVKINGLFGIGLGTLIVGVVAIIVGIVLIVLGIRTRTQRRQAATVEHPPAGGYPPTT